jgi:hypothetical protein
MNSPQITSTPTTAATMAQSYVHPYMMPIKCEPCSPTTVNYSNAITSGMFSQYIPMYSSAIAHSPQLPPTPPSPMSVTSMQMPITPIQSSFISTHPMSMPHSPIMTTVSSSNASSPCPSVTSIVDCQVAQHDKKPLPVQKSTVSGGIAARIVASKQSAQTSDSIGKRLKLNGCGRSTNSVNKRNERERKRVKNVNQGFQTLRARIPNCTKKMSKVETLRSAVDYIRELQQVLHAAGGPPPTLFVDTDCGDSNTTDELDFFDLDELLC